MKIIIKNFVVFLLFIIVAINVTSCDKRISDTMKTLKYLLEEIEKDDLNEISLLKLRIDKTFANPVNIRL